MMVYAIGFCHEYDPIITPAKTDALFCRNIKPFKNDVEKREELRKFFTYQPKIHSLTLLNNCTNFGDISLSGYPFLDSGSISLEKTACDSTAKMPIDALKANFKIYDYEQAPIAMYQDNSASSRYFELMEEKVKEQTPTLSYLLFGRGISKENDDFHVDINVAFNFADPNTLGGNDGEIAKKFTPEINESIRSAIEEEVRSVFSKKSLTPQGANIAEEAGIRKMMELIRAVIAGSYNPMNEAYLKYNGFVEIQGDWSSLVDENKIDDEGGSYSIYDYAGLYQNGKPLRDIIDAQMTQGLGIYKNSGSEINNTLIITDSEETAFLDKAKEQFRSFDKKMMLWYHFVVKSKKMYVKATSNLTQAEMETIIENELKEIRKKLFLDLDEAPAELPGLAKSSIDGCGSFSSFSAKKCWLDDNTSFASIISALTNSLGVGAATYANLMAAITCGFIDEMLSSVQMIYKLGESIVNWNYSESIQTVQNYWTDLWGRAYHQCIKTGLDPNIYNKANYVHYLFLKDIGESVFNYLKGAWKGITEIFNAITNVISNWEKMAKVLWEEIKKMLGEGTKIITSVAKWVGAKIGENLGSILTAYLTGGAITAAKSYISNMKGGVSFLQSLAKIETFKEKIKGIFAFPNPLGKIRQKLCKWKLIDGCFVAGTPVKVKNGSRAIESLTLGESVISNTKVTNGFAAMLKPVLLAGGLCLSGSEATAANTNLPITTHFLAKEAVVNKTFYIPLAEVKPDVLTSDNQRAIDNTEWTNTEWYSLHLSLEKENGQISKIQLLRPQWWLDENRIKKAND